MSEPILRLPDDDPATPFYLSPWPFLEPRYPNPPDWPPPDETA
ncbi:hypothetical protein ABZ876_08555 [Streptomyces sp. NPDC046931]